MNIILFGPQGSGKGTQAGLLVKNLDFYHFSTGDEFRKEIKSGTEHGKDIARIINAGNLVPDDITNVLVMERAAVHDNILFDGYPRTEPQYHFMLANIPIYAAIEISLSDEEAMKRALSRRLCKKCGAVYNLVSRPPKTEGICDLDGNEITQRADDNAAEISKRLGIYRSQTEPLKKFYAQSGILHVIDGSRTIAEVYSDVEKILKR